MKAVVVLLGMALVIALIVVRLADDRAGWTQVVVEVTAIGLAVAFYFLDYRRGKEKTQEERKGERDRKNNLQRAILLALKRELEMNWRHLHSYLHDSPLPRPGVNHAAYYNPTHQVFKVYRDDAIMLALSNVESDVLLDCDLAQSILEVSQAVRFVNQQIDELMAFRFGDPSQLARASLIVRNNPRAPEQFALDEDTIPAPRRAWFEELARRHRAIVNEGYWGLLRPSLENAQPRVDAALKAAKLPPLKMPSQEAEGATTTKQVVSSSASGFRIIPPSSPTTP